MEHFRWKRSFAQYRQSKTAGKSHLLELEQLERENRNEIRRLKIRSLWLIIPLKHTGFSLKLLKALLQADADFQDGFIDAISYLEIEQEYRNAALNLDNQRLRRLLLQAQLR